MTWTCSRRPAANAMALLVPVDGAGRTSARRVERAAAPRVRQAHQHRWECSVSRGVAVEVSDPTTGETAFLGSVREDDLELLDEP